MKTKKLASVTLASLAVGTLSGLSAVDAHALQNMGYSVMGSGAQVRTQLIDLNNNTNPGYFGSHEKSAEAKCGEGKCGEGKCGEEDKESAEAKCGEGKCGEGKCGDKEAGEAKCGDKDAAEAKCGDKDSGEAKCGEGKCGS